MKQTLILIARPICRLVASALWQLIWLLPVWGMCWYGKVRFPEMIRAHFKVDQLEERLASVEKFAELMKNTASLSNPTALMHYISAQFSRFSVATKLNTMEMTSHFFQTLCLWGLNLIWILAVIYAVIRMVRSYRSRSQIFTTTTAVARELDSKFLLLQQEIMTLREEIQSLKKAPCASSPKQEKTNKPHE